MSFWDENFVTISMVYMVVVVILLLAIYTHTCLAVSLPDTSSNFNGGSFMNQLVANARTQEENRRRMRQFQMETAKSELIRSNDIRNVYRNGVQVASNAPGNSMIGRDANGRIIYI